VTLALGSVLAVVLVMQKMARIVALVAVCAWREVMCPPVRMV
jgi:hypothetical protein